MASNQILHVSPGRIILASLILTIIAGTCALLVPSCQTKPIALIDVFFTAVSATCVTGLTTVPLNSFSIWGKVIILLLVQIGGLGLVTMTIFILSIFKQLGFTTQLMVGKILELETWKDIRQLLFFIIKFTVILEAMGALATFLLIDPQLPYLKRLFFASFHAVSSFCDAGFTVWPR